MAQSARFLEFIYEEGKYGVFSKEIEKIFRDVQIPMAIISLILLFIALLAFVISWSRFSRSAVNHCMLFLLLSFVPRQVVFFLDASDFSDSESGCKVVGFILQITLINCVGWNAFTAFAIDRELRKNSKVLYRKIGRAHLVVWPISLAQALLCIPFYGPAGDKCWIPSAHGDQRMMFFYIPLFLGMVYSFIVILQCVFYLRSVALKVDRHLASEPNVNRTSRSSTFARRMLAYIVCYIIVRAPSLCNRGYEYFTDRHNVLLFVLHSLGSSSEGAVFALVFGFNERLLSTYRHYFVRRRKQRSRNRKLTAVGSSRMTGNVINVNLCDPFDVDGGEQQGNYEMAVLSGRSGGQRGLRRGSATAAREDDRDAASLPVGRTASWLVNPLYVERRRTEAETR